MTTTTFARIYGIVFLIVGVAGFVPGITPAHEHPGLAVEAGSGMLFGLFPVNVLHNIVHIAFGIWGVVAARSYAASKGYAKAVAVVYGLLMIMGLLPFTNDTFGLVPIGGNDIWLHALLAAGAAYFGFVRNEDTARQTSTV